MSGYKTATSLCASIIASLALQSSWAQSPLDPPPRLAPGSPLPAAELEPLVDGIVRAAMARDHIAGVTVGIIQGGQVVLKKGYGTAGPGRPVDPDRTLFRIGSISKTFTWIAAMKEVESGRMRLDGPINDYLPPELAVPAVPGWRPVELRDLMSHTPGFEDRILDMFAETPAAIHSLAAMLKLSRPKREFPPGTVTAYSNVGVMLAGEAVSRIQGASFPDVIEREITSPLGMTSTTFREPFPARADLPSPMTPALASELSTAYRWSDGVLQAQPTEWLTQVAPAGGASSTAKDMTRYMLMMLGDGECDGVRIYSQATAAAFRTPIPIPVPGGGEVDHGFLQMPLPGGFMGYGHDGETLWFQSMLVTVPALKLGIFISANTDTGQQLAHELAPLIVAHFYGAANTPRVISPALRAEADAYAGTYVPNRRPYHGLQKFLFLLIRQSSMDVTADGYLITETGATAETWVPSDRRAHFLAAEGPLTSDFSIGDGGVLEWHQPGGTESFVRVGPLYQRRVLVPVTLIVCAAALWCLVGAVTRSRRALPITRVQRRLNGAQLVAAAAWIVAFCATVVFATGASNLRNLIFGWPGAPLLTASCAALLASLLSTGVMVGLPFAWISTEGWGLRRKLSFSAVTILFCALATMLACWGFLEPWDP